ncbi:hypothetical protein [Allocoleopsis franciscana]|nr:hypothetical protein [Allocoleopsis franciscana]
MTARFRLAEPAIQDIEKIADYIARQSGLEQGDSEASKAKRRSLFEQTRR